MRDEGVFEASGQVEGCWVHLGMLENREHVDSLDSIAPGDKVFQAPKSIPGGNQANLPSP